MPSQLDAADGSISLAAKMAQSHGFVPKRTHILLSGFYALLAWSVLIGGATADSPAATYLDHWPQWRGPLANGSAPHGDPPTHWAEDHNVRWKLRLPSEGNSTPIVWNDHVFILAAVETERAADDATARRIAEINQGQLTAPGGKYVRFVVMDVEGQTGQVRWERTAAEALPVEGLHQINTYASASPITDGESVYVSFGSRGVFCYDFTGNLKWRRDLGQMRTRKGWGEGASPALYKNVLYVNWDHEGDSFLVALDAQSGEDRWRVKRDEPTSWSTPLIVEHASEAQVIVSATNRVRSYRAETGELLWECGGQSTNVISSPVLVDDTVVCMSWYGDSFACAIHLDSRGDVTSMPSIRWATDDIAPYGPSPLLYADQLFVTRANTTVIASLDARTGEFVLPMARVPLLQGEIYASPVGAAGRVYYLSRDGTMAVIRPGDGRELDVIATNHLAERFEASPAIVGKRLYLRGREHLYCLEESGE